MSESFQHEVEPAAEGMRLDLFLSQRHADLSRARIQGLVEGGSVTVDGKAAKAAKRLKAGQQVAVEIPPARPVEAQPESLPLSVLFEDEELVVLDKAAGMVVHPAHGNWSGTLVNALLFHVEDLQGIGGELRPGIVHRLDKDTSGCLVVAKSDAAMASLQAAFKARTVEKTYLALVHGSPAEKGTFDTAYGRHAHDRIKFTSKLSEGKRAVTHWKVKERFSAAALVEVALETGRTHQIRVHLSDHGFPLLADDTYGGTSREKKVAGTAAAEAAERIGRQALHAWRLAFTHPKSGKALRFEAPLPADFTAALERLRRG